MKLSPTPAHVHDLSDDHYQLHTFVMGRRNRRVVAVLSLVIVALLLFQQFSYDVVSKSGIVVSGPTLAS